MKNLFICLTPLQSLIAQSLIRQTAPTPADLLMFCYIEANNTKFRHYYQETAQLCQYAKFVRIPQNKWLHQITLPFITKNLSKQYDTIYAASIDNLDIQYPLSHLSFRKLETFDDGTANLYPDSILYQNQKYGKKSKLIRKLQGIRYTTEDLRQLSSAHHTLYPTQKNIVSPTIALKLWQNSAFLSDSGSLKTRKILLGQPLFDEATDNISLFQTLLSRTQADAYFPHPRESYRLSNVDYIDTPLIFEDYLLKQIQQEPHTEFHIYHIASTAALNVAEFPHTKIHAIRPQYDFFQREGFNYLYDLMAKMNIEIQT